MFLLLASLKAIGQQEVKYFHEIERQYQLLTTKLDSFTHAQDSKQGKVKTYFNRDIDFGYRHQQVTVTINFEDFKINFLTIKDSICLSYVAFDTNIYGDKYKTLSGAYIDTVQCLKYIALHNNFYGANKSLIDLGRELTLNEIYSYYCGAGSPPKTQRHEEILALVKQRDAVQFRKYINSINCEEQTYGADGFILLQKKKVKLPSDILQLVGHVRKRNSTLVVCNGDTVFSTDTYSVVK
jgi:hypothetical protein